MIVILLFVSGIFICKYLFSTIELINTYTEYDGDKFAQVKLFLIVYPDNTISSKITTSGTLKKSSLLYSKLIEEAKEDWKQFTETY